MFLDAEKSPVLDSGEAVSLLKYPSLSVIEPEAGLETENIVLAAVVTAVEVTAGVESGKMPVDEEALEVVGAAGFSKGRNLPDVDVVNVVEAAAAVPLLAKENMDPGLANGFDDENGLEERVGDGSDDKEVA